MSSTGKCAIVTGGSRGIGRAICARLAKDGFNVVVNYAGNAAAAAETVALVAAAGAKAVAVQGDVGKLEDVKNLFSAATEAFGGVDVVVANAGVQTPKPIHIADTSDEQFDLLFNTNSKGAFYLMREGAVSIRPGGSFINVSTTAIALKMPGYAVYNASKAAVEAMTPVFAKELRGKDITCNCVAPGPTATELFFKGKTDEVVDKFAQMSPLQRLGQPEEIASAVSFLAGPEGRWVNGQIIRANGGIA